jgi:hypothetical protein
MLSSPHIYSDGEKQRKESPSSFKTRSAAIFSSPCYISNSSLVVIVVVCCCCCYCCCSALCSCCHLCVYMCVPEISSLIVVCPHSRRICGVFISIFNISPVFLFLFFSSFAHSRCSPDLVPHAYAAISRGRRLTTIPSVFLFLRSLFFVFSCFFCFFCIFSFFFFACCCLQSACLSVKEKREREREREHPTRVLRAQLRSKNK